MIRGIHYHVGGIAAPCNMCRISLGGLPFFSKLLANSNNNNKHLYFKTIKIWNKVRYCALKIYLMRKQNNTWFIQAISLKEWEENKENKLTLRVIHSYSATEKGKKVVYSNLCSLFFLFTIKVNELRNEVFKEEFV